MNDSKLKRGLHIVFEGPDGAGKSTQIELLKDYLTSEGFGVTLAREPGGTEIGKSLRKILLETDADIDPRAEALMMAADRAQDVAEVIVPNLEKGQIVLSDRYIPSSLVYQGYARNLGEKIIAELSDFATNGHVPDLILCFDIDDDLAKSRMDEIPDRIEKEGEEFAQFVRETYRKLSKSNNWSRIDANGTTDEVFSQIKNLIIPLLPAKN